MPSKPKSSLLFFVGLIILGTVIWSSTMVKSGLKYDYGLGFWGANGHDGIWHIAVASGLSRGSTAMPIFSGHEIKNYHLGFSYILSGLNFVTSIPIDRLYFQVLPPLIATLVGISVYSWVLTWSRSPVSAWWSTFMVYFGGSLGWIVGKGESAFWVQQSISTLINPPLAVSFIIIMLFLASVSKKKVVLSCFLLTLLSFVKAYAGLVVIAGLLIASFKNRALLRIAIYSLIPVSLVQFVANRADPGLLLFKPLWFLDTLFSPDRLDWARYHSALNTYKSGQIIYKLIPAYLFAFGVFLVGNLGSRLIFLPGLKNWKRVGWEQIFLAGVFVAGIIPPMLFVQQGTAWNVIQFFYYSCFAAAILSGVVIGNLITSQRSKLSKLILSFVVVLITVPTTTEALNHYLPDRPPARISLSEVEALSVLKTYPSGVVLTQVATPDAFFPPPRPLYRYESTGYVSAYSNKQTFLEDSVNLNITGFNWQPRKESVNRFFAKPSAEFLDSNGIIYIYLLKNLAPGFPDSIGNYRNLFENDEVRILGIK